MNMLDAPSAIQRQIDELRNAISRRKMAKKLQAERDILQEKLDAESGRGSLKDSDMAKKIDKWLFK